MSAIRRSLRDLTRKKLRTIGVVIVIGLSLGVYLGLASVANQVSVEVSDLESAVQDVVQISLNGSGGPLSPSPQNYVNASILPSVQSTPHVTAVQPLYIQRYSPTTGQPGCNFRRGAGGACVLFEAESVSEPLVIYESGVPTVAAGSALVASDANAFDAMIGINLASKLSLTPGDALDINGTQFTIVGTFTTATSFGDSSVIVPYATGLTAFGAHDPTVLYATVDSPGNVNVVVNALRAEPWDSTQGYDIAALINSEVPEIEAASSAVGSLTDFASSIALLLGTLIIVFVMVVATRERIREIGLMKALGFRNSRIVLQSFSESMLLAALGFLVSLVVFELLAPSLQNLLTGTSARATGGGAGGVGALLVSGLTLAPSLLVISETLAIAVLMGAAGAVYPVVRALRLRPAEALRYE